MLPGAGVESGRGVGVGMYGLVVWDRRLGV